MFSDTLKKKVRKTKTNPTFYNSSILPTKDSGVLQTARVLNFTEFYKWRN